MNWVDARKFCKKQANKKGQLATIHDQYTNDFLVSLTSDLTDGYTSWIGGYKLEGEGQAWFWSDWSDWSSEVANYNWVDEHQQGHYGGLEFNR